VKMFYQGSITPIQNLKIIDRYASLIGVSGMPENYEDFDFNPNPIWDSMRDFRLPSGGILVRGKEIKFPIEIEPVKKPRARVRRKTT